MSKESKKAISSIRLFAWLSTLFVIILTGLLMVILIFNNKRIEADKSITLYHHLLQHTTAEKEFLDAHTLSVVNNPALIQKIIKNGEFLLFQEQFREAFYSGNIQLYCYEDFYYYAITINTKQLWFQNTTQAQNSLYIVLILSILVIILLFLIQRRSTEALCTVNELENARTVFIRNMMHEFKTPLTRLTLGVHRLDEHNKEKESLLRQCDIFGEYLNKFEQLEAIKSLVLRPSTYPLIDIIEEIEEYLQLDDAQQLLHNIKDEMVTVDYGYFYTALKNLIDNGFKYGLENTVHVSYKNNTLYIYNPSKPLSKPFSEYLQAFQRGNSNDASGMGLGLYISQEILQRHRIAIKHRYIGGVFYLILDLKEVMKS
jgi:two-component system OmpR family sensor kinase